MADAPPWPNFSLLQYCFFLLCPIIIAHLLALLPSYMHDLARCSCIRQHVSLLRYLQILKYYYPPPRKKKVRPRLPSTLATLRGIHFEREDAAPPTPRLAVFAVGWFLYTMSCRVEMCCHRAASMMTRHSRALCQYQSCAAHANTRSGANAVCFDSDSYPVGVDGHASCCMGNHPDQFEDLQLTTDGKSVSGIGSSVILKEMRERGHVVICTDPHVFCKFFKDDSGALELARLPKLRPCTKHITGSTCAHVWSRSIQSVPMIK